MATLFPIFLKLERRRVLVVGAGSIAEQKLDGLLAGGRRDSGSGAELTTESCCLYVMEGYAGRSATSPADLDNVVLVIAATGNPDQRDIYREAETRGDLFAMRWTSQNAATFIIRR